MAAFACNSLTGVKLHCRIRTGGKALHLFAPRSRGPIAARRVRYRAESARFHNAFVPEQARTVWIMGGAGLIASCLTVHSYERGPGCDEGLAKAHTGVAFEWTDHQATGWQTGPPPPRSWLSGTTIPSRVT